MSDSYHVRFGPPADRSTEVRPGDPVTLGSGPDARIPVPGADAVHCRLDVTARGLEVFNQSKLGTFVNGRKVERSLLRDGDDLKLGEVALKVAVGLSSAGTASDRFPSPLAASGGGAPIPAPDPRAGAARAKRTSGERAAAATPSSGERPAAGERSSREPRPPAAAAAAPAVPHRPPADIPLGAPPKGSGLTPAERPAMGDISSRGPKPSGALGPPPPPRLGPSGQTRAFDSSAVKSALSQAVPGAVRPQEEQVKIVMKERDGSALLAAPNEGVAVPISRKDFFGAAKQRAGAGDFVPAPAFEPVTGAIAAGPAGPGLTGETPEEAATRAEIEASGLQVIERLGGHARVTVYRARRKDLGQEVVVRAVHLDPGDPEGRAAKLLGEAKLAARLHHPSIVQVHGVFRGKAYVAIVLESLHGIPLSDEVAARGCLTAGEMMVLAERLGTALSHAHALGVEHRGVAPRNTILTNDGEVKLVGFGDAISAEADPGQAGRRADVVGLASTLHFALSGAPLVVGQSVAPAVPPPLARVFARSASPRPEDRFDSVDAFLASLREAARHTATNRFRKTGIMMGVAAAAAAIAAEQEKAAVEPLGFQGRLPGVEIVSLLRDVERWRRTGRLEIKGAAADGALAAGAVYFRDGLLVRAAVRGRRGAAGALSELARLPMVEFAFVYAPVEASFDEEKTPVAPVLESVLRPSA